MPNTETSTEPDSPSDAEQTDTPTEAQDEPARTPEPQKKSLEDSLSSLDNETRSFVLGQISRARQEAKGLRDRLRDAEPKISEYDRLIEASKTDMERAQDKESKAAARSDRLAGQLAAAEIRARAASTFQDPDDATIHLDAASYVGENDQVDTEAIARDLESLLAKKPHLGRAPSGVPAPNPAQNGSAGGSPKGQYTKAQVEQMTPDEIMAAKKEGLLDSVLGVPH